MNKTIDLEYDPELGEEVAEIDWRQIRQTTARSAPASQAIDREWRGEINRHGGDYARWVQRALNQVLGLQLIEDGVIGTQSRSAIRSFQRKAGLSTDGIVGPRTEAALIAAGAPPVNTAGPVPSIRPGTISVPKLLRRESSPPAQTLYVEIDLHIGDSSGGRVAPMTGLFIPTQYSPDDSVDLILYLHGFKTRHPSLTIDGYWNRQQFPYWPLREGVTIVRRTFYSSRQHWGRVRRPEH